MRHNGVLATGLVMAIAFTTPFVDQALGQTGGGQCRKGPKCEGPPPPATPQCDLYEKLYENYKRKEAVSRELFQHSYELNRKADEAFMDFAKENLPLLSAEAGVDVYAGDRAASAEAAAHAARNLSDGEVWSMVKAKGSLLKTEAALRQPLTEARYAAVAEVVSTAAMIAEIAKVLDELGMTIGEMRTWWKESADAAAKARDMWAKALADFKAALTQATACQAELEQARERARARQRLLDQAKALIDDWQLPGGYLYKDPSGQILDAGAALKRAVDLLSRQPSRGRTLRPTIRLASLAQATSGEDDSLTYGQVVAAVPEVDRAVNSFRAGMDVLIGQLGGQERVDIRLVSLIQQMAQ